MVPTEQIALSSALPTEDDSMASFSHPRQKTLAYEDLVQGLQKWRIWFMLASQDIQLRYRRSVIGPFWITLSMAITVYSMGYLYAHLFKIDMDRYYPFLVAGMLGWSLILSLMLDFTEGFLVIHSLIKQIKLPYTVYLHRIIMRNYLMFFHHLLVMLPIFVIFHNNAPINACTLFIIPGLALLYLNVFCYGSIIAMFSARYRDVPPIIKSMMQVIFFVTPVMWQPQGLQGHKQLIAELNPFYVFLELIRAPLLGKLPTAFNFSVILFFTVLGVISSALLFTRYRARIIYWL
jgi:lipopolysaccharide transport system permease protein